MPIDLESFTRLKRTVDKLRRERDQAEGALKEHMRRLKDQCGAESLKEAKVILKKLNKEVEQAETQFTNSYATFQEQWVSKLKGNSL